MILYCSQDLFKLCFEFILFLRPTSLFVHFIVWAAEDADPCYSVVLYCYIFSYCKDLAWKASINRHAVIFAEAKLNLMQYNIPKKCFKFSFPLHCLIFKHKLSAHLLSASALPARSRHNSQHTTKQVLRHDFFFLSATRSDASAAPSWVRSAWRTPTPSTTPTAAFRAPGEWVPTSLLVRAYESTIASLKYTDMYHLLILVNLLEPVLNSDWNEKTRCTLFFGDVFNTTLLIVLLRFHCQCFLG